MKPLLDRYGVNVVAISSDPVVRAAAHQARDGLPFAVLADPSLDVIKAYGIEVRHMRYVTWFNDSVPIGIPKGFRSLAIPTTLLIDEAGTIRWIDQATDYRIRSDNSRIEAALADAFSPPGPPR